MKCRVGVWGGVLASVLVVGTARAQIVAPVGTEFQVNTYTTGNQTSPATCGTGDGSFVVVWDNGESGRIGIFGQRYTSDGSPTGTEFLINTYTSGQLQRPSVCCDQGGNFVVTWNQERGHDGNGDGVFGQRFSSDGSSVGTEFQVNSYTSGDQNYAMVCCSAAGDFVVSWESYRDQDGDRSGVFGQRFSSSGALSGTEFQINTYTLSRQGAPAICCSAEGDFVVAWDSDTQDGYSRGIFGQRFDADGSFEGTEFQINTYTPFDQRSPEICCAASGDFVVAWESVGQDTPTGTGIFSQRFDSGGGARGSEFQVSLTAEGNQQDPGICCGPEGDFVVVWDRALGAGYGIFARRFSGSGVALSGDVTVSFPIESYQTDPVATCFEDGGFVVIWEKAETDGDDFGIFGRRFGLLEIAVTPTLSWLGLGTAIVGLLAIGMRTLLRRA